MAQALSKKSIDRSTPNIINKSRDRRPADGTSCPPWVRFEASGKQKEKAQAECERETTHGLGEKCNSFSEKSKNGTVRALVSPRRGRAANMRLGAITNTRRTRPEIPTVPSAVVVPQPVRIQRARQGQK